MARLMALKFAAEQLIREKRCPVVAGHDVSSELLRISRLFE